MKTKREMYLDHLEQNGELLFEYYSERFNMKKPQYLCGQIWYDPTRDWIYTNWGETQHKATDTIQDSIQVVGNAIIAQMKAKQCFTILNDNTEVNYLWGWADEYIDNIWTPTMLAEGLKTFTWILGGFYSKTSIQKVGAFKGMPINKDPIQGQKDTYNKEVKFTEFPTPQKTKIAIFQSFPSGFDWHSEITEKRVA